MSKVTTPLAYRAVYELVNADYAPWVWDRTGVAKNIGGLRFELADRQADETRGDTYGGYYAQGSTSATHLIWKVTDEDGVVVFLKRTGSFNSYGDLTWDGAIREVVPTTKTVQVYEFA